MTSDLMDDKLKYNLFRLAPRELSHSAFWGWILQSLDAGEDPRFAGIQRVARRLLAHLRAPALAGTIHVRTEVPLPGKGAGRLDIQVHDEHTVIGIENKVQALPDAAQVTRYKEALERTGKSAFIGLVSTAFDVDVRAGLPCPYAGAEDLLAFTAPERGTHPLVTEYVEWIECVLQDRRAVKTHALSNDPDMSARGLSHPEGQWELMADLTTGFGGIQYRGDNNDGTPWTQFRFTQGDETHDDLFYRIDRYADGYYFGLRQYQSPPRPNVEAKDARLQRLRKWWASACGAVTNELKIRTPVNRAKNESDVATYPLKHNPPGMLRRILPSIHEAFLETLRHHGWSLLT